MRKAQSILEYTILVILIVVAFLTMQNYVKRGFQGQWKQAADNVGEQYDLRTFTGNIRHTLDSTTNSTLTAVYGVSYNGTEGMISYREDTADTVEKKTGTSHLDP